MPVEASATDNVGVTSVQFKIDGVHVGSADTAAPYRVSWNTTTVADGSHTITAEARDAANNVVDDVGRGQRLEQPGRAPRSTWTSTVSTTTRGWPMATV